MRVVKMPCCFVPVCRSGYGDCKEKTPRKHSKERSLPMEAVPCTSAKSPPKETYKRLLEVSRERIERNTKKIKVLQQTNRRLKKKVNSLNDVIKGIRENNRMSEDTLEILGAASSQNNELLVRQLAKAKGETVARKYRPELRAFALTLHFYSPSAYSFVRNAFNTCLPHPRTISKWYRHINGTPGFTSEAFQTIKLKIEESPQKLIFALMMDEMAIRQQVEFDGKSFRGYVNMGVPISDDSIPLAFVLLLVCINANWKILLGYFLVDGLNGTQRAYLVNQCLTLLASVSATVVSLTFDGLSSNLVMARLLGCNIEAQNLDSKFHHPVTDEDVIIYLDPSHMLKLIRNTLGEKKSLVDDSNEIVDWKYVVALHNLQEVEGLQLANKLRNKHVHFQRKKMKLSLAAQVLSRSVADSIEFCNKELQLPDFKGSEATVKFIRLFNDLFDLLNSRSIRALGWKKALCPEFWSEAVRFLNEAQTYILSVRESRNGAHLVRSNRKTGFLGFLICISGIRLLFETLVMPDNGVLDYIPTYRLSQDHLELVFAGIRRHGGCNNNPTSRQFSAAYKKLLLKTELNATTTGNCISLAAIPMLNVNSSDNPEDAINATSKFPDYTAEDSVGFVKSVVPSDHDYMFDAGALTICSEHVVYYISGFVVKKLTTILKCDTCTEALYQQGENNLFSEKTLICYKDKGHLIRPSKDVFIVCKMCESYFRRKISEGGGLKLNHHILHSITSVLGTLTDANLFSCLREHILDADVMDNHIILLIRAIIKQYLSTRFAYFSKTLVDKSASVRHLLTKVILFKGQ